MKAVFDKFWRYFLTGGFAALVDIAGFAGLIAAGLTAGPAAALSYLVANTVNFTLTSRFVYATPLGWRRYLQFMGSTVLGFVVNVAVTLLALHVLGLPPVIAKTVGLGTAFLCNFAIVHFVIYGRERTGH